MSRSVTRSRLKSSRSTKATTTLKVGTPYVEGAKVTLTIVAPKKLGPKTINFKAKRRKGYRRTVGHRQGYTIATVKSIA